MPNGHITEQYTRPKRSVRITSTTTTPRFNARIAGSSCILATHPSQRCATPLTSTNNSVAANITRMANTNRTLFNTDIFILFYECLPRYSRHQHRQHDGAAFDSIKI